MEQVIEQLYGLKVGDKVQYIGNNEKTYNKSIFNKKGVVNRIVPQTGEFHVKLEGIHYEVSFQRNDLLLLEQPEEEAADFEGLLTETSFMSAAQMKSYLTKYHDLQEGKDFSVTDRDGTKEVMLNNEKYVTVLKDLFSLEKVNKELVETKMKDFKHTMLPQFTAEGALSLTFKASNWTFRTHLAPWSIQYSLLLQYGLDLYEEWGFENN